MYGPTPTGLPFGILAFRKTHFGTILEGLGMVNVGIFYFSLAYFMAIGYIL
jgi:hypothetical protein